MKPCAAPPRLARWLLGHALPDDVRAHIDGDLLEVYAQRCAQHGPARARLWYCMEAASFSARFLLERVRGRSPQTRRPRRSWSHAAPSAIDLRLGLRMLLKYPGLSVVSVTGMAIVIAIGAGALSLSASLLETTLPLPAGDRVIALRNAILTEPGRNKASLRDFEAWRDAMQSVEELSAFQTVSRTLTVPGAGVDQVKVVRMTASGFRIAQTTPLLGRTLVEEDDRSRARVVVIGFDEWQGRFAADAAIVGREIRLGSEAYTIVGVMPQEFGFPVDDRYWIPLHFGPAERERPDAVSLMIFGRLTDGATIERAQAEIDVVGSRMAAAYPGTHAELRARALPYTRAFFDIDNPQTILSLYFFRLFTGLLLVVVAVNVAILVYARTATRAGEIAVRTALGASRARVVTQLFVEALVLSLTAALVGLTIAGVGLAKLQALAEQSEAERKVTEVPFWIDLGLSPAVIAYALVLAVLGAAIIGVIPGLQATGRRVQAGLQRFSGHGARMQLGRVWTTLIIAQVAVAVAVLPFAMHFAEEVVAEGSTDAGYPAEEFLEASLVMERPDGPPDTSAANRRAMAQRFSAGAAELIRRIESDAAIAGVTVRNRDYERLEVEDLASSDAGPRVFAVGTEDTDRVRTGYFALYGMPIVAGRGFTESDVGTGATAVIVNQVFVEDHFGGSAALGRHLRIVRQSNIADGAEPGPWLEIVGVVRDFRSDAFEPSGGIYLPLDIAQLSPPVNLAIRVRARSATSLTPRLRELAASVDPALQLEGVISAAERHRQGQRVLRYLGIGTTAVMVAGLLLSAAGIYAMMSFTVVRRRREIGIRSALGADPRRVLGNIFARASAQLGAGILLGLIGTYVLDRMTRSGPVNDGNAVMLLVVAVLMTAIGLLAAIGPARRGLAVQPTEALREE